MMGQSHRRGRVFGALVLAVGLAAAPGCLTLNSNLSPLPPECVEACEAVPGCCRGKVYVFLVNGLDPLDLGHVAEVRAALIRAGFTKVYDGQLYHAGWFAGEMRRLRSEEPGVRFVVVGFGAGVEAARWLAGSVAADGIDLDLLASVDAPVWSSAPAQRPANVRQTLSVHGRPLFSPTNWRADTDVEVPVGGLSYAAPHPFTISQLATELAAVAGMVPAPPVKPLEPLADDLPTPRPTAARADGPRDEWDFLKPVARLREAITPTAGEPAPTAPAGERTVAR